jgi:hypothetical protein
LKAPHPHFPVEILSSTLNARHALLSSRSIILGLNYSEISIVLGYFFSEK